MEKEAVHWPDTIFVCIPAYTAAASLQRLLPSLLRYVPPDRVCVVDDASYDGSDAVCARYGVAYLKNETNQGKGAALTKGFGYLLDRKARWILTMDADGQHAVEDLHRFTAAVQQFPDAGIIIGARRIRFTVMPPARIFSNTVTSLILSLMCGRRILDSQSGYRIYSSELLGRIPLRYKRFEMESEIILKACGNGFEVRFVPVQTLYCSHRSHISHIRDMLRWVSAVSAIGMEIRRIPSSRRKKPPALREKSHESTISET